MSWPWKSRCLEDQREGFLLSLDPAHQRFPLATAVAAAIIFLTPSLVTNSISSRRFLHDAAQDGLYARLRAKNIESRLRTSAGDTLDLPCWRGSPVPSRHEFSVALLQLRLRNSSCRARKRGNSHTKPARVRIFYPLGWERRAAWSRYPTRLDRDLYSVNGLRGRTWRGARFLLRTNGFEGDFV